MTIRYVSDCMHTAPGVGMAMDVTHPDAGKSGRFIITSRSLSGGVMTLTLKPLEEWKAENG